MAWNRPRGCVAGLLVFLAAVAPFAGAVRYGRVNCDDYAYTGRHRPMATGLTRESVRYAFTDVTNAIWMPLTHLAYGADFALSGGDDRRAMSFAHTGNVLWHGLNAVLLFILLSSLFPHTSSLYPLLLVLLWAVHPLRCESVAWISSKKDVMSAFFLLLALIGWVRWRRRGGLGFYGLSLLAVLVGAMCKPSVMVFVGIVALMDWFVLGVWEDVRGLEWSEASIERALPTLLPSALRRAAWYVLPAAIGLGLAVMAAWAQAEGHATGMVEGIPFWWRALNAACSCGIYALHTILPFDLAPQCVIRWPELPRLLWIALAVFGACVWAAVRGRRIPGVAFGALWFFGCLVPFLGLSGFGYHAYADRFTYIPAMGLSAAVAAWLAGRGNGVRTGTVLLAAVVALGIAAAHQTSYWADDLRLWTHTIEVDGERSYLANHNLGVWHWEFDHDVRKSATHFARAWEHDPAALSRGVILYMAALLEDGQKDEAHRLMLKINEHNARATRKNDLAKARGTILGEYVDAEYSREMALVLSMVYDENERAGAESEIARLVEIEPRMENHPIVLYCRAKLAEFRGDREGARRFCRECREKSRPFDYVQFRYMDRMLEGGK